MGADVSTAKRPLAAAFVFAGCVLSVMILSARSLAAAWSLAPDLGHGWALPWLMGWLVWERLEETTPEKNNVASAGRLAWAGLAAGLVPYAFARLLTEPFP